MTAPGTVFYCLRIVLEVWRIPPRAEWVKLEGPGGRSALWGLPMGTIYGEESAKTSRVLASLLTTCC